MGDYHVQFCEGMGVKFSCATRRVWCFQYQSDAVEFYEALIKRLAKFNLQIAEEKTKILEFGRFAEQNGKREGKKKPDTFDFLGFTHYCSKSRKGKFRVKRKTSRKKVKEKVKQFKQWIKRHRHKDPVELMKVIRMRIVGHYRYYGITDNSKSMELFLYQIRRILFKWLNRRSQRRSFNWEKFSKFMKHHPLPAPKIYVSVYDG